MLKESDLLPAARKVANRYFRKTFPSLRRAPDLDDMTQLLAMEMWANREKFDPNKGNPVTWAHCCVSRAFRHLFYWRHRDPVEASEHQPDYFFENIVAQTEDIDAGLVLEDIREKVDAIITRHFQPRSHVKAGYIYSRYLSGDTYQTIGDSLNQTRQSIELVVSKINRYLRGQVDGMEIL